VFVRIDPSVEPTMFRGATISPREIEALRTIERVVLGTKVRRITSTEIVTDHGAFPTTSREVHVDCTAAGIPPATPRPVFEPGRITLQYVTIGIVPWSAATIAAVEARRDDDTTKNRLCPPISFSGNIADVLTLARDGMAGLMARGSEPDLAAWDAACRLNPARAATEHLDDPRVTDAFASMTANIGAAVRNLSAVTSDTATAQSAAPGPA
jgi:hypothetical protein